MDSGTIYYNLFVYSMLSCNRIGPDDSGYKLYRNHFSTCDLARPAPLRQREKDRKKYMCGRFSLDGDGHFEWSLAKV